MQYGISQADAEEILNKGYNLTQLRNNPIIKLNIVFSEDKVRAWKEKIKRKRIPNRDFHKLLKKSDFECVLCNLGNSYLLLSIILSLMKYPKIMSLII